MASTTQDTLYDAFSNAAGSQAEVLEPIANASDELAESLQSVTEQTGGSSPQTYAETNASAPQSAASETLSIATTVLESGLGLIPLVTGLIGLFTGGDGAPAALTKYAMPDKIDFEGADTGSGTSDMDYDQMGMPRVYDASTAAPTSAAAATSSPAADAESPAPITGNAQAMDSQWFMDHSSDIAQAVRYAMLNMSSINDVVSSL
jgi:hypothetical protein